MQDDHKKKKHDKKPSSLLREIGLSIKGRGLEKLREEID